MTRRRFVALGTVAGAATLARAAEKAPAVQAKTGGPVVVSSSNGHQYTNGGPRTCVAEAWERIARGEDVLDALIAGVNIVELDPLDTSVGYGGLPNADGVVQLDACCMHGPRRRAGGVACLEGVRTPSMVARVVMNETDHHLLVGRDAQAFARRLGFRVEDDLNTERSREKWLEWKRATDPGHWLAPAAREEAAERARRAMIAAGRLDADHVYGTIHCNGIDAKGELCGVTTTSGLAFKIPGRVGDSPILGAGNYVDADVGVAGSTGRGEANLYNLSAFLIVEALRRGAHPKDAGMEALQRVRAATREKRLLNERGLPNFNLKFYVLDRAGRHAGVALYGGPQHTYAVCTAKGPDLLPMDALLPGAP